MKSARRGSATSRVEITNVSRDGFSLRIGRKKRFVRFDDFPWFRDASIAQLTNVTLPSPHHLHWPELDVDLAVESLDHPERYPLVSRAPAAARALPKRSLVKERLRTYGVKKRER
jgi:Protein of unknown function (DUF2442)